MRLVVTGHQGQVASALHALAGDSGIDVVLLGRPTLDLERPDTLAPVLSAARPDVVVSAAAYTAVDQAESDPERAHAVNAVAPGMLARAAADLGAPIIHLSTDYVFDGQKPTPYLESDATGPQTAYGATKLAGEVAVRAANPAHVVLRTAWVYAPHGKNFVRTMLQLAQTRDRVSVVADQLGNPTSALDIAQGVIRVARKLHGGEGPAGVYHMTAGGEASWADFARAIFAGARRRGAAWAEVDPIASVNYPTPARRPPNSRLACAKIAADYDVRLPSWPVALDRCLDRLCGQPTDRQS